MKDIKHREPPASPPDLTLARPQAVPEILAAIRICDAHLALAMEGDAVISEDGLYRYVLNRRWSDGPVMAWVGLNPSTADHRVDDPSVRRMCGFARREGCGGICVLNLYAMRSPNPSVLREAEWQGDLDPVGPDNDKWLAGLAELAKIAWACGDPVVPVVLAWGAHPMAAPRAARVLELLHGIPVACLGTTASGAPRHPLYVRADAPLIPWRMPS